jgi:hypothetical protein
MLKMSNLIRWWRFGNDFRRERSFSIFVPMLWNFSRANCRVPIGEPSILMPVVVHGMIRPWGVWRDSKRSWDCVGFGR